MRYELLRESENGFVPTGEFVPDGEDPHAFAMAMQEKHGTAYASKPARTDAKSRVDRMRGTIKRNPLLVGVGYGTLFSLPIWAILYEIVTRLIR